MTDKAMAFFRERVRQMDEYDWLSKKVWASNGKYDQSVSDELAELEALGFLWYRYHPVENMTVWWLTEKGFDRALLEKL